MNLLLQAQCSFSYKLKHGHHLESSLKYYSCNKENMFVCLLCFL